MTVVESENGLIETTAERRSARLIALAEQECPREAESTGELHDWCVAGPALLLRAARSLSAMFVLRPGAYDADASALLRIVFENVATFAWLAIDPIEHGPVWVKGDFRQRLAAHRELSIVGDEDVIDAESVG